MRLPRVSIVTPSLNQGRFLEATIESVLAQTYPNIEYLVMDGGSSDNTLQLLRRYEGRLRFCSAADGGQSDAVNQGFHLTQGELFGFLNADDLYLPDAVEKAVAEFAGNPGAAAVAGEAYLVDEESRRLGRYPCGTPDLARLSRECVLCQPAVFLRRQVFEEVGLLNPALHFALDYDLWIRIAKRYPIHRTEAYLAACRVHPGAKTQARRREALRESIEVVRTHFGFVPFPWIYEYACALTGQGRQPVPRSALAWLVGAAIGANWNRRQLGRFWEECRRPVISGWWRYLEVQR